MSGPAPKALREWLDIQHEHDGDSVFLTDPQPWLWGEAVDLTGQKET